MLKKILLAIAFIPTIAFAQSGTISQLSPWISSGSYIKMASTTAGFRIPSLNCTSKTNGGALTADASGFITCTDDDGGAGGSQTPWTSNIVGAGYSLSGVGSLDATSSVITQSTSTNSYTANLKIGTLSGILKATNGSVGTASAGTDYEVPVTAGDGLTRTGNDFDCDTASGSVFGCLLSTDWTVFNGKIGSTSLSATGINTYSSATGVIGTDFSLQNTWTGHNIFSSLFATNASSTNATTTTLEVSGQLRVTSTGTSTFAGGINMGANHLVVHGVQSDTSDGLHIHAGNGTNVGIFGAGNTSNSLFYGGVNIDGATRLATSLNGLAFLTNGAVSGIATSTLNLTALSFADSDWGDITIASNVASVEDDSHAHTGATLSGIDISADTNLTAGDALTLTDDDIDFDGGATPAGALGGTWASPTVDDDGHNHTGTTLSGIDISSDTNLSADGTEIILTGDALSLGTSLTFTQATTTNFAVSSITSAIMQTNGNGTVEEYAGTSCTNQFVRSLSALGVATCATVQTTDVASGIALDSELPVGANPTATIGLSANNGVATTFMRSDASPALSQSITPTWTGLHTFNTGGILSTASSTIFRLTMDRATSTNATSTNLYIGGQLSFNGVNGSTWASFCTAITGGSGLCDGSDDGGAGGGYSLFSTSTVYTSSIFMNAGDSLGLGTTTNRSALSMLALATTTGNHLTLRNGNYTWFQKVNDTGSYFFGTTSSTYATATHSALIVPATGGLIVQGSGSSTLLNGITIQNGCYSVNGTCIGSGGTLTGSNASAGRVGFWSSANNIDGDADFSWNGTLNKLFASGAAFLTSLEIATGTAPTVDRIGGIAFDTTDNQFLLGTSTASDVAVFPTKQKLWGATIASSSLEMVSGGRLWLPPQRDGFDIMEIHCAVDAGTSVVINISNSGGTTDTETVTCDADGATDTNITTNPSYNAGSLNSLEIGTITGAVDYLTFSVWGNIKRE